MNEKTLPNPFEDRSNAQKQVIWRGKLRRRRTEKLGILWRKADCGWSLILTPPLLLTDLKQGGVKINEIPLMGSMGLSTWDIFAK